MKREDGVTLVELLITIAIIGIIVGALGTALIVGLRTDAPTAQRLGESHDAQLLTVHLPSDVASASSVDIPGPNACGGSPSMIRLRWTEQETSTATPTVFNAAYRIVNEAGEWRLVRSFCVDGGSPETLVVAHRLKANCASPDCTVTASGRRVTMQLMTAGGYSFTVSGNRRPA